MVLSSWKNTLTLVLLAVLLSACSSDPTPPPPLVFNITADSKTNGGGLFYFVVRNTNEKQFMLESYKDVAGKTFSDPSDRNALGFFSIVPGSKQQCEVSPPAQGSLGLYFLYTQPGSQWKKLLTQPLAQKYQIHLTAGSQVEIKEQKAWYSLF